MRWQSLLVPAALVALLACEDEEMIGTEVRIEPVPSLLINEEVHLQARLLDRKGRFVWRVGCSWSSFDPTVVAVTENATARGLSAGSATVIATCGGVEGSAQVEVQDMILERFGPGEEVLHSLWGSSATDVFAVGESWECWWRECESVVLHYDGSTWTKMSGVTSALLYGVWGSSATDVFAVGDNGECWWGDCRGVILHYDGSTWTKMATATSAELRAVWGSSAEDVFVVGQSILHYDGQTWSRMPTPAGVPFLTGIWGSSGTDVFAVGEGATILHYDGNSWSRMAAPPVDEGLRGIAGTSGDNVFAVGETGIVLHYDGIEWKRVSVSTTYHLTGIWGASETDVYVVGSADDPNFDGGPSVILHYDGTGWEVMQSWNPHALRGLWGTTEDVFFVGSGSTVLRVKR